MLWPVLLTTVSLVSAVATINRPVYKVILTQKGFTQFVQYDVETPPIREFTFCTWIKLYNLHNEQSIFTYIVNGNKRVVRLWVDSGGNHLKMLLNEREVSSVPVDLGKGLWRHVCISYQSDFGAWALYLDSRLISCEASQALQYFVIPGGGSVILGYGTTEQGSSSGLEGEIFGANMILTSTIGRNYSMLNHPQYEQKSFHRNKIQSSKNIDYIILDNLDTDESPNMAKETKFHRNKIQSSKNIDYIILDNLDTDESPNVAKETKFPVKFNKDISFIKVQTPYSNIKHAIGTHPTTMDPIHTIGSSASGENDIFNLIMDHKPRPMNNNLNLQKLHLPTEKIKPGNKLPGSDTYDFLMISEHETPPPLHSTRSNYMEQNLESEKEPESIYKINEARKQTFHKMQPYHNYILDTEVPPPPEKDTKVYGQWTSSKYAGNVLNYLKSINYNNKNYKVPPTIQLTKMSDNFPYPSNFNTIKVRPPTNLQKKSMHHVPYHAASLRRREKREARQREKNVKILEDDIRTEILNSHAKTNPVNVDIINRGISQKRMVDNAINHRFTRNNYDDHFQNIKGSMFNELPFLKSIEYFTGNSKPYLSKASEDMYVKSFATANKWHNIQTYNNDYTPRRVPGVDSEYDQNRQHPAIRLKYTPENHKVIHENIDEPIVKGRQLAKHVSNQSEKDKNKVSILKYNHGFLPGHSEKVKNTKLQSLDTDVKSTSDFHKHVKIGNALNERNLIGNNEAEKKHSFIGGDEKVPDIHRYRSEIDNEKNTHVPPSLTPRVCKNLELLDHLLYVHPDGSIKMSRIVSPIKTKNIALEFIILNYKKCSLNDSYFQSHLLLLIDWNKTPVRLFGGAIARRTTDLCGFF